MLDVAPTPHHEELPALLYVLPLLPVALAWLRARLSK